MDTALVERFSGSDRLRSVWRSGGPERDADERPADAEKPARRVGVGSAGDRFSSNSPSSPTWYTCPT